MTPQQRFGAFVGVSSHLNVLQPQLLPTPTRAPVGKWRNIRKRALESKREREREGGRAINVERSPQTLAAEAQVHLWVAGGVFTELCGPQSAGSFSENFVIITQKQKYMWRWSGWWKETRTGCNWMGFVWLLQRVTVVIAGALRENIRLVINTVIYWK